MTPHPRSLDRQRLAAEHAEEEYDKYMAEQQQETKESNHDMTEVDAAVPSSKSETTTTTTSETIQQGNKCEIGRWIRTNE
jgi:hypothetical protein